MSTVAMDLAAETLTQKALVTRGAHAENSATAAGATMVAVTEAAISDSPADTLANAGTAPQFSVGDRVRYCSPHGNGVWTCTVKTTYPDPTDERYELLGEVPGFRKSRARPEHMERICPPKVADGLEVQGGASAIQGDEIAEHLSSSVLLSSAILHAPSPSALLKVG